MAEEPKKQVTSRFELELHRLASIAAAGKGLSLSEYVVQATAEQLKRDIDSGLVEDVITNVQRFQSDRS